jgi:hypothetical protein
MDDKNFFHIDHIVKLIGTSAPSSQTPKHYTFKESTHRDLQKDMIF